MVDGLLFETIDLDTSLTQTREGFENARKRQVLAQTVVDMRKDL